VLEAVKRQLECSEFETEQYRSNLLGRLARQEGADTQKPGNNPNQKTASVRPVPTTLATIKINTSIAILLSESSVLDGGSGPGEGSRCSVLQVGGEATSASSSAVGMTSSVGCAVGSRRDTDHVRVSGQQVQPGARHAQEFFRPLPHAMIFCARPRLSALARS
jgi:hypothetical protein